LVTNLFQFVPHFLCSVADLLTLCRKLRSQLTLDGCALIAQQREFNFAGFQLDGMPDLQLL